MENDHQTIEKKKPEKKQGFNGIRTRDLREADAMLYQLSYEATQFFALVVQNVLQIRILKASKLRSYRILPWPLVFVLILIWFFFLEI